MDRVPLRLIEELAEEFSALPVTFVARAVGDNARCCVSATVDPAALRRDLRALLFLWSTDEKHGT